MQCPYICLCICLPNSLLYLFLLRTRAAPPPVPVAGFPTLFIAGANSDYCTSDSVATSRTYFADVSRVQIEGAGHWVHSEKMDEFVDTVCKLL